MVSSTHLLRDVITAPTAAVTVVFVAMALIDMVLVLLLVWLFLRAHREPSPRSCSVRSGPPEMLLGVA